MASSTTAQMNMKQTKMIRPKSKKKTPEPVPEPDNEVVSLSLAVTEPEPETEPETELESNAFAAASSTDNDAYCDPELFVKRQIKRTITVPFYKITKAVNITQLLRTELAKGVEGRCSVEGYISPNSISICSHSCGTLSAANIHFDITADCLICFPDEHTVIKCVAKTITQAGIRAGARYLQPGHVSPIEVFLSRDMNTQTRELFSRIEENDILTVEIIGRRFVLHDTHVTIIAMLLDAVSP
jgi:hypothetical protein